MNYQNKLNQNRVSPIYLLPNMFTIGAMFAGFYAIVQSINSDFIATGIALFFAMILDSLDGRVARLTHTSSPFGAQLDSLSDMVCFGVAPAIIAFNWQLKSLGKIGWLVAFLYCACAGLRLARFNTLIGIVDKKYFVGLPTTAAAPVIVGYIFICTRYDLDHKLYTGIGVFLTLLAAFSMVASIKFYSFKEFHIHHKARFRALLIFLIALALLIIYPDLVIFGFFFFYTIISYIVWIFKIGKKKESIEIKSENLNH